MSSVAGCSLLKEMLNLHIFSIIFLIYLKRRERERFYILAHFQMPAIYRTVQAKSGDLSSILNFPMSSRYRRTWALVLASQCVQYQAVETLHRLNHCNQRVGLAR